MKDQLAVKWKILEEMILKIRAKIEKQDFSLVHNFLTSFVFKYIIIISYLHISFFFFYKMCRFM